MYLSNSSDSNGTRMTLIELIFADFSKILSAYICGYLRFLRSIGLST
jgi:hypothetical protein